MLKRNKPRDDGANSSHSKPAEGKASSGASSVVSPRTASSTSTSQSASSSSSTLSNVNVWLVVVALGWFLVVYKGAQLTKKHGLHLPVANYLGVGLGEDPITPGLAYSILSHRRKSLLVCGDDQYCSEVEMSSTAVKNSCFAAAEVLDDMDDQGGLTHSRVFYIAYVCPGKNYMKWLSYDMSKDKQPYKRALRVKLFDNKTDASPWRLYKDAEGEKLQCYLDGPGKDHWIGVHKKTGSSVLVLHADSEDRETMHSSFTFAMVADSIPSKKYEYAVFHESVKGFLTCGGNGICRVIKNMKTAKESCFKMHRQGDRGANFRQYNIQYTCPRDETNGMYLSTVTDVGGTTHVGLVKAKENSMWKVEQQSGLGSHVTLISGKYSGYVLGPSSKSGKGKTQKEFFFIRRANLTKEILKEEEEDRASSSSSPSSPASAKTAVSSADVKKYSSDKYKFKGCYIDKWDRDLPSGPRKWGFTKETCMEACKGFLYFGLEGGSWCCCGNKYGKHGPAPLANCNDKSDQMLGGSFRIALYEILGK
mmetsp:Transcript_4624/g.6430  ORF Transcript_4624/g.6430 Transcript_4624/m.6430 type:complete len:534 (+) Transcript_4624:93-1694(+)